MLLVDEKDQPIPNKTVHVTVDVAAHRSSFTTNERGVADISIDTTSFTAPFITVTVNGKGVKSHGTTWGYTGCMWTPGIKEKVIKSKIASQQGGYLNYKKQKILC